MSKLRVIAGKYKGRYIAVGAGLNTRPTTARIKEAWASTVSAMNLNGFVGLNVLDAFAGSGALGIEALSRGAKHCVFVEKDHKSLVMLKQNLQNLSVPQDQATIISGDIFKLKVEKVIANHKLDAIFLDPPYDTQATQIAKLLTNLIDADVASEACLISYEQAYQGARAQVIAREVKQLQLESAKRYGDTVIEYYRYHFADLTKIGAD